MSYIHTVASVSGGPGHHSAIQLVSGQHTVVSMRGPPGATWSCWYKGERGKILLLVY